MLKGGNKTKTIALSLENKIELDILKAKYQVSHNDLISILLRKEKENVK